MRKVILILLVFIFYSFCESSTRFNDFLGHFEKGELPFQVNEALFNEIINKQRQTKEIDTLYVSKYIEENKELHTGIKTFEVYRYYAITRFELEEIQALLFEKRGGGAGFDSDYYLITYNSKGDKIARKKIGKKRADCSRLNKREGELKSDLKIAVKDTIFNTDCESEVRELKSSQSKHFYIDDSTGEVLKSMD